MSCGGVVVELGLVSSLNGLGLNLNGLGLNDQWARSWLQTGASSVSGARSAELGQAVSG